MATLIRLQEEAVERASKARPLSPIEAADAEDAVADWLDDARHRRRLGSRAAVRPGRARTPTGSIRSPPPCLTREQAGAGERDPVARLHGRDRDADERDHRLGHPDLRAGRRGAPVLPAGPGPLPGHRRARPARQHPGHARRQDRAWHHGGQGVRPEPAEDPGLPGRAQPGLDEPDRQRGRRDGRDGHADHPHRARP